MIAIIDYGMGNLRSVQKAFEYLGLDARITSGRQVLKDASHVVLPGVGAISDALINLEEKNLRDAVIHEAKSGKPFLGICLGMQLMLQKSYENGEFECLGLIPGEVVPFQFEDENLKVPHMGWNSLIVKDANNRLIENKENQFVYFVHSYYAANVPGKNILAGAHYGFDFTCAVQNENMYGLQFHPEKSGDTGLLMLEKFGKLR